MLFWKSILLLNIWHALKFYLPDAFGSDVSPVPDQWSPAYPDLHLLILGRPLQTSPVLKIKDEQRIGYIWIKCKPIRQVVDWIKNYNLNTETSRNLQSKLVMGLSQRLVKRMERDSLAIEWHVNVMCMVWNCRCHPVIRLHRNFQ